MTNGHVLTEKPLVHYFTVVEEIKALLSLVWRKNQQADHQ